MTNTSPVLTACPSSEQQVTLDAIVWQERWLSLIALYPQAQPLDAVQHRFRGQTALVLGGNDTLKAHRLAVLQQAETTPVITTSGSVRALLALGIQPDVVVCHPNAPLQQHLEDVDTQALTLILHPMCDPIAFAVPVKHRYVAGATDEPHLSAWLSETVYAHPLIPRPWQASGLAYTLQTAQILGFDTLVLAGFGWEDTPAQRYDAQAATQLLAAPSDNPPRYYQVTEAWVPEGVTALNHWADVPKAHQTRNRDNWWTEPLPSAGLAPVIAEIERAIHTGLERFLPLAACVEAHPEAITWLQAHPVLGCLARDLVRHIETDKTIAHYGEQYQTLCTWWRGFAEDWPLRDLKERAHQPEILKNYVETVAIQAKSKARIVSEFNQLLFYERRMGATHWLGIPMLKYPTDLFAMQQLITTVRPDWLIETGTHLGGSAFFFASVMELMGHGQVISIDPWVPEQPRPQHSRIHYYQGSSIAPETHQWLKTRIQPGQSVMVTLDALHEVSYVTEEMRCFAPWVTPGSYLVVEDTNQGGHPVWPIYSRLEEQGMQAALEQFTNEFPEFSADPACEAWYLTCHPNGYLKRCALGEITDAA